MEITWPKTPWAPKTQHLTLKGYLKLRSVSPDNWLSLRALGFGQRRNEKKKPQKYLVYGKLEFVTMGKLRSVKR